jgi:uncharacterized membrane protein
MHDFSLLAAAAVLWFLIHRGIAGSRLRPKLVARIGEGGFRGLFAVLSLVSLSWLIYEYSRAPWEPLLPMPAAFYFVPLAVVPLAFVFFIGAFTVPNPTAVAGERALESAEAARGMLRVTRHPFLYAVMLWSAAHLLVSSNVAPLLFFGSFFLTAAVGTRDIDRKRARSEGQRWQRFARVTSNLPFAAIAAGRNRLVLGELVLPLAIGLTLAGLMLYLHSSWFGVSALAALP